MDPITDIFNRIKNGQMAQKEQVIMPFSKLRFEVLKILKKHGFIADVKKRGRTVKKNLIVDLEYLDERKPALAGFKRISKPGQRIYRKATALKSVKSGHGLSIVSTPKGLMTGEEARKNKLGGEVFVEIW